MFSINVEWRKDRSLDVWYLIPVAVDKNTVRGNVGFIEYNKKFEGLDKFRIYDNLKWKYNYYISLEKAQSAVRKFLEEIDEVI